VTNKVEYILTDIEGTTTSVSFVYDVLFPYFRKHIWDLKNMTELEDVKIAFEETRKLAKKEENVDIESSDQVIQKLDSWCELDRKITPLKTLQGILWKVGYEQGVLKGHVYNDVPVSLQKWRQLGIKLGVFSSGSVEAQKLIFGFSEKGNLTEYFSNYFDTTTGMKRDVETYTAISKILNISSKNILFLSDIVQELEAADKAGYQTIQIIRPGTVSSWKNAVSDFASIVLD
jgi:enolase-phosphatase E1